MGSAVSGLPAVYVPGVLAVARIYAVAAVLIAFYMPSATGISNVSDSLLLFTSLQLLVSLYCG
jgi:hypothetical protein